MSRPVRQRHLPSRGVVAAALVLAGLAVLLVVGVWASRLGAPPQWAFDCDDTTCTDLWAAARGHYLRIAVLASAAVLLGAVLGSLSLPRSPVPRDPVARPGPAAPLGRRLRAGLPPLLRLLGALLLAASLLWGAAWLTLAVSRPSGLGAALIALLLAAFSAWRCIRPGAESDRAACWAAAAGTMVPVAIGAVMMASPLAFLGLVLLLGAPLLGDPGADGAAARRNRARGAAPAPRR